MTPNPDQFRPDEMRMPMEGMERRTGQRQGPARGPGSFIEKIKQFLDAIFNNPNALAAFGPKSLRGRLGGRFDRAMGRDWLNGPHQFARMQESLPPEAAAGRLEMLKQRVPGLQFEGMQGADGKIDPQTLKNFCEKHSVSGADMPRYVAKLEAAATRIETDLKNRPGWENWKGTVVCDGYRMWMENGNETAVSTGTQLLFAKAPMEQVRSSMQRLKDGENPSTTVETIDGKQVRWEVTGMGNRYTLGDGNRKSKEVYERNNGAGASVEHFDESGRVLSVQSFGDAKIARMNVRGGPVQQSAKIEEQTQNSNFAEGTYVQLPNGQYLGKSSVEARRLGVDGYLRQLSQLSPPELGAYLSGVMFDQDEAVYNMSGRSLAIAFARVDVSLSQALLQGRGDCRQIAMTAQAVLNMKGIRSAVVQRDPDHCAAVWVERVGGGYVARSIETTGFHDDFDVAGTPGEAIANTWDVEKTGSRKDHATVLQRGRPVNVGYDQLAASLGVA